VNRCPTCGQSTWRIGNTNAGKRRRQLAGLGDEWTEIASGSSRWHVTTFRRQYGDHYEFRHERISRLAGDQASYRVLARRRATDQQDKQAKETAT
jgi:hypothetical protein